MRTILCVIGTRPEAIKMAPVIQELRRHPDHIRPLVCLTGQHQRMVGPILDNFAIRPDIELNLGQSEASLAEFTGALFPALDRVVLAHQPDWLLAQGDTSSVLVAALVAFYARIPFGHVEAGLRTGDIHHPFPEEVHRYLADKVASLLFAPTERNRQALLREGLPDNRILVTGNTVIDALRAIADQPFDWAASPLAHLPAARRFILVTAHRRESFGAPFRELCGAIRELAETFRDAGDHFVFPVHLNPNVRRPVQEILADQPNLSLLEPLDYRTLVHLMKRCALVLTDSGGIQEEAPGLGLPVLVLRETTERPEGVAAGVARLLGTSRARIVAEASQLLRDPAALAAMARAETPYGDGHAAPRIVAALRAHPGTGR